MGISSTQKGLTNEDGQCSAVQVYVRVRPLIKEELGHTMMEYKVNADSSLHVKMPGKQRSINPAFGGGTLPPRLLRQQEDWKVFNGFTGVLDQEQTNEEVYVKTIQPLLFPQLITKKQSACIFTYGHTGSGKSHTLLGYEGENSLGVYKYATDDLISHLNENNVKISEDLDKLGLLVRITELYKDKVIDLLTDDVCTVREDDCGVARIRGPLVEDEEGRIDQKTLGLFCRTSQEIIDCVDAACESRRVGTSTHHSQSSRSHLVLEFEIVSPRILEQRNDTMVKEAELTRLKWLQTELMFGKHIDRAMPKWTEEFTSGAMKLGAEIRKYEELASESKRKLKEMEKEVCGTLVFCDLAGNEYARDASGSTKEEMAEAAEINKSLLAVKEMVRSLNDANSKLSYRDSKLSMILRRHVQGVSSRAIMMGHVSPSQEYIRKTVNTLTYCSMVGKRGSVFKPTKTNVSENEKSQDGK